MLIIREETSAVLVLQHCNFASIARPEVREVHNT